MQSASVSINKKQKEGFLAKPGESLESAAWRSLADTYRTVYFHINSDLRQYGLTPPQYAIMRIIGWSPLGSLSMSEIGKEMIVTYANITTIVDNLEKRQLVRRHRNTEDRRVVRVELTRKGRKLFEKIFTSHRNRVRKLMQVLTEHELENLVVITTKIKDKIGYPRIRK